MKKKIITVLFLFNLFLLLIGCSLSCGDRLNDDCYDLLETSAAIGDTVEVVYWGAAECNPDLNPSAHNFFGGLAGLFDEAFINVTANQFNSQRCSFIVPPKAVSSTALFGKDLFIEYPKTLTCIREGDKVTVKYEKPFFNIFYFSKEKAKLLLENGYPLVWLDGEAPTKAKSHVLEDWSPLEGKDNYVLESITPYQVTFIIPNWFKDCHGGDIHILNENGFVKGGGTELGKVKIAKEVFEDKILSKLNDDDKEFLKSKYKYHEEDDFYCLNEDAISSRDVHQNIKRILRQTDYYDKHVPNIEPDPDDPHAFFSSKEKLIID